MAIKKSELYSSLWKSCDELRGGMDASQYKDYVLVMLFVKYVSDKYAGQKDALLDVPAGGSFADMVALKGDKEIGDRINKIIEKLAGANEVLQGIAFPDFNDDDKLGKGKEMVDRLSNLVAIFNNPALDFRGNRAEGDDLLGDAYEYLMRHFATESGKSKGQFYTPAEVSRVMSMVIDLGAAKRADQSIYDPTCGSGSLLLKAHDEARSRTRLDLALYGQEMDNATAALAKMNMVLHDCPTAEIWKDNSLAAPYFKQPDGRLKTFDFVVANFPFSNKAWSNGIDPAHDLYGRFEYGIPPAKNGDYAFLLHILSSLKSTGKGAVIHPHGVLFRGNVEADIRKRLIRQGNIKGIIGLPPNLFYGTGIPACILVLDKENAGARKGIFMIDASKGFIKDGNKNRLRAQDIHRIVDTFTRQVEIPRYSRMVPLAEISDPKNDYNLNLPRYIDSTSPEDLQDIDGHLRGGIPDRDIDALDPYWQVFPAVRPLLFESAGRPGYTRLKLPVAEIKNAIFGHPEFTAFNAAVTAIFGQWKAANAPRLHAIAQGDHPKALIETLSEGMLDTVRQVVATGHELSRHTGTDCRYPVDRDVSSPVVPSVWVPAFPAGTTSESVDSTTIGPTVMAPLIDAYDVYQHLMDYWAATMQDDVYLIVHGGWAEAAKPRLIVETKEQKSKEQPDFTVGKQKFKSDLIPAALLVARYFAAEQAAIEAVEAELGTLEQKLDELKEEHGGEGGLLEEVAFQRAYANLANELDQAGYSAAEIDTLKAEVDHYTKARDEVRLASGDYIDLKMYEPAIRHLIDTYIRAEESEKISAFDDLSLIQLIVERGPDAVEALPKGIRENKEAVAETIENNVRRLIINESPVDPAYYEKMSKLLDALIALRRKGALDYKKYLAQIAELTKQATNPGGGAAYPGAVDTPAKRALYNNLGKDEALALAVDQAVQGSRQDGWRGNPIKVRKVKLAIKLALQHKSRAEQPGVREDRGNYGGPTDEPLADLVDRILELVKNQNAY